MRLSELKTGEKGVIIKVMGHGGFRRRIIEMGFIKGKTVEVILNAPLKDPHQIQDNGIRNFPAPPGSGNDRSSE